jgi:hypothetical protein
MIFLFHFLDVYFYADGSASALIQVKGGSPRRRLKRTAIDAEARAARFAQRQQTE